MNSMIKLMMIKNNIFVSLHLYILAIHYYTKRPTAVTPKVDFHFMSALTNCVYCM